MPWWKIKAAIQGTLSLLPEPQKWNRWFQQNVTRSLDLSETYFLEKWRQCDHHLNTIKQHGKVRPVVMELGTGWFPITPIGFALNGAKQVYSVDRQSLLDHGRVLTTLERYLTLIERGKVVLRDETGIDRLKALLPRVPTLTAEQTLQELNIHTLVTDARRIEMSAESVDVFSSNNTFEHIPRSVLADILREFHRLGRPDSIMSHYIDLADHYAGFDANITVLNFLRFSENEWKWYNNDLQYQNRLRVSDYRAIHHEAGWTISNEENVAESRSTLEKLPLSNEFRAYKPEDLVVYKSWMTSRKS